MCWLNFHIFITKKLKNLDSALYKTLTSKDSLRVNGTDYIISNFKRIYKYYSSSSCPSNTFSCINYMIVDCLYSYNGYGNANFYSDPANPDDPNNWPIKIRNNKNLDGATDF